MSRSRPSPLLALAALVVIGLLLPLVGAQGDGGNSTGTGAPGGSSGDVVIDHDTTWDTPHTIDGLLRVTNGATLQINGTHASVRTLLIENDSVILARSVNGSPAILSGVDDGGWVGAIHGTLIALGEPDVPVILQGIQGRAQLSGSNIYVENPLDVFGKVIANRLLVRNYTSGLKIEKGGVFLGLNTTFASSQGLGLMAVRGRVFLDNATFDGVGASAVAATESNVTVHGARFLHSNVAIHMNTDYAEFSSITVDGASTCLGAYFGTTVLDGFTCTNYSKSGIQGIRSRGENPTLFGRNVSISTDQTNSTVSGIVGVDFDNMTLTDSTIGPVPGSGIEATRFAPWLERVRFQGAGVVDVRLIDPPTDVVPPYEYLGESGKRGWVEIDHTITVTVIDPYGVPAGNAGVTLADLSGRVYASDIANATGVVTVRVPVLLVNVTQETLHPQWGLHATDVDNKASATLAPVPPTTDITLNLKTNGTSTGGGSSRGIPAPPALLVPTLGLGLALALARPRRS